MLKQSNSTKSARRPHLGHLKKSLSQQRHSPHKRTITTTKPTKPKSNLLINSSLFNTNNNTITNSTPFNKKSFRTMSTTTEQPSEQVTPQTETCVLGIGCYWGVEHYMRKKYGDAITDIKVGFMGGKVINPTYRQVCGGDTDHVEVAQIIYNPQIVSFKDIIKFAFTLHDPTTMNRQGGDAGTQYASVIFYDNDQQKKEAEEVKEALQRALDEKKINPKYEESTITTQLRPMAQFYSAHDEHQMYLIKNPDGYCNHRIRFKWDDSVIV